ncbi:MAG: hypothetical protein KAR00_01630 [Candidatus Pacebacteria bacterium]|nr:hypothetical protein [Candidatus Paceibacterota bacterium]
MSQTLITTITEGQKKQIKRFAEDAVDCAIAKGILNKDGIQRLIENGGDFQSHIAAGIKEFSASNQYANEEVNSHYTYPKGYKIKGITEQTNILRQIFPGVGYADEKLAERPLPANAEGWFAIPRWERMSPTYGEAVQIVFGMIKRTRNDKFYTPCPLDLNRRVQTVAMLKNIGDQQRGSDILVIPAQFGVRYRGMSVRRVREIVDTLEFGMGVFQVAIMLLTHPERFQQFYNLWIDCAGDDYIFDTVHAAPYFSFRYNKVRFSTRWVGKQDVKFGSISGFVPK